MLNKRVKIGLKHVNVFSSLSHIRLDHPKSLSGYKCLYCLYLKTLNMCLYDFFRDFLDGNVESLMNELEIEKSLKHHEDIVDEIECIEKTLLKRRAELREADRLLAEAESELSRTKEKVCSAVVWGEAAYRRPHEGRERKCDKNVVAQGGQLGSRLRSPS